MAESTLSLLRAEARRRVAFYAGYGRRASLADGLTSAQNSLVGDGMTRGERDFLLAHDWSFLHPKADFVLWSSVAVAASVTATGVYGSATTITSNTAKFYPGMVGKTIAVTTIGDLTIATYVSSTVVTVAGDHHWSGSKTFSVAADGTYPLPDDFGGMESKRMRFGTAFGQFGYIEGASRSKMDAARQVYTSLGRPTIFSVEPIADDGTGQRFKLIVSLTPDQNYPITFRYNVLKDVMADGDYVIGGMPYSEAFACSCLGAMEAILRGKERTERENQARALAAAIQYDLEHHTDTSLGRQTWSWSGLDEADSARGSIIGFQVQDEAPVLLYG